MVTPPGKRVNKEVRFWLDMMPGDIRECIARAATRNGKCTDEALNLALTSKLQSRAVLATIPKYQTYLLPMGETESLWAKLLVGHLKGVLIFPAATTNISESVPTESDYKYPLLNQLLRAPQLEIAGIPGYHDFLLSVRHATSLHHLSVSVQGRFLDTLVETLRCLGPQLTTLSLVCSEMSGQNGEPSSRNCPMNTCVGNDPSSLPVLCPNLRTLNLICGHIQPGTISSLVGGLPFLESVKICCAHLTPLELSEEDITSLKTLEFVKIGNLSGGLRRVSQVGRSLTSVLQLWKEGPDATLELTRCPRLRVCYLRMSIQALKKFADIVAPLLPELERVSVTLDPRSCLVDIEVAVIEAVKILRIRDDPATQVHLRCDIDIQQWGEMKDGLDKVATIIENEGVRLDLNLGGNCDLKIKITQRR